ncbi:MAG: hypothetical protein A2017_08585 [Lentisphaerae bacterium GWF2_44_16]|nr:MAG: hypothetical protein A2017_08585 [Lentisphaerae bacterium GWF2_44_16]
MIKINVLTNNGCPNSKAFNCPLLVSKKIFAEKGFKLNFNFKRDTEVLNADCIFINSNVFRPYWKDSKKEIFSFLESARSLKVKTVWFDTTDSTWCTQFEVLPFVDKFLKSQIFADKNKYLERFRTGRIFTDTFDSLYNAGEESSGYSLPEKEFLSKIDISWNTCFENYTASRFGIFSKIKQFLRPLAPSLTTGGKFNIDFIPPEKYRNMKISCRTGLSHSRPSVVAHRRAIGEIMKEMGVEYGKISLPEYFHELENSQSAIGPFGVGEITLRDYEIIICGAALLKPDMEHLRTWPELFAPGRTYIPFRWDLSDLKDKIKSLENADLCRETAKNAQNIYKDAVSGSGMEKFCERLLKITELKS